MLLAFPKNRLILFTSCLIVSALVLDKLIINFPIFSISNRDSIVVKSIFFLIIGITGFSILNYVRITKANIYESSKFTKKAIGQTFVIALQIALVLLMFLIVTEIILFKSYHSVSIKVITILVGIMQVGFFGSLIYKMLQWLLYYRDKLMVIYLILIVSFLITSTSLILYINLSLDKRPFLISHNQLTLSTSAIMYSDIENYYSISYSMSFILMWLVFTIIIKNQTAHVKSKKFWIVISFPLIYYFGNSELINVIFLVSNISSPIIYFQLSNIAFSASTLLGSIFFGFTFWLSSRKIDNTYIRKYAYMLSIGIMLFFISNQISPISTLYYPPFGLASTVFIGISSYFIVWSVYSVTTFISIDKNVRKLLIETKQDIFLGKIGSAHKSQLIHNEVKRLQKKVSEFAPQYNVFHPIETEEYLKKVIEEKIERDKILKQEIEDDEDDNNK